jgi:hypothetical protein
MAAVGGSGGADAAHDAPVITFGDFSIEETQRVLHQGASHD